MKLGFNPYMYRSANNSVSFQSGELNHLFPKRLSNAKTSGDDAMALLHSVDEDLMTFSKDKLEQVKTVCNSAKDSSVKYYLGLIVEAWEKVAK